MSTLRTNTLQDAAGNNSVPMATVAAGTAKAWVNFNGQGTSSPFTIANGFIKSAFNVTSITDLSTGAYQINFTTAMQDENYVYSGAARDSNNSGTMVTLGIGSTQTKANTSCQMRFEENGSAYDSSDVAVVFFR
jgi:hypothetical protein